MFRLADYALVIVVLALLRAYLVRRRNPSGLPLPPGPKPLPIIGNIFDIPKRASWETYAQWGQQYGGIMSLKVLGRTIVVLNSHKVARDLLEKRGTIYSDRPALPSFEMMNLNFNLTIKPYGSYWRTGRSMADHSLRQSASLAYRPMLIREARRFLGNLVRSTDDVVVSSRQLTAAVIMSLTYGYEVKEPKDHFVDLAEDAVERAVAAMLPGATAINTFPALKYLPAWLPGMSFKREAIRKWQQVQETVDAPFEFTKGEIKKGTARPSMIHECIESFSNTSLTEREETILKEVAATSYIAGIDTTTSTIAGFFVALALYPDVQKHAQDELDAIVGRDRLPDFQDRHQLPYVEAICQELRRWRLVAPFALPHATSEDDIYEGYFIPKGSQVLANCWAMLHDPDVYPEPEVFRPDRFLASDGTFIEDPLVRAAFGFGRRLCPGRFLANDTLWAVVVSVLSVLTVGKAKDIEGREIPVSDAFTDHALICHPMPFKCSIIPRDVRSEQLIIETSTNSIEEL